MNEVVVGLVLPSLALAAYLIFAPIEFGSSLFHQFPQLLKKPEHLHSALSPIWKVSNVFLIFALTGMAFFFAQAIPIAANVILIPFVCAMLAFLIRTTLYLHLFFSRDISRSTFFDTCFTITNFAVPLFFGLTLAYLLSGKMAWFSLSALAVSALIISSLALGVSTFYLRFQSERDNKKLQNLADGAFLAYVASAGIFLPWVAKFEMPHLYGSSAIIWLFAVLLLFCGVWLFFRSRQNYSKLWACANICFVLVFACLVVGQWPWLIYSSITFSQAFSGQAFIWHIVIGLVVSMVFIAPGFFLLYKLMAEQPPQKSTSLKAAGLNRKDTKGENHGTKN